MSSSSSSEDSEEYFDAIENIFIISNSDECRSATLSRSTSEPSLNSEATAENSSSVTFVVPNQAPKQHQRVRLRHGRQKFNELRHKLQTDDEDPSATVITASSGRESGATTPQNSQSSSVDGFLATLPTSSRPSSTLSGGATTTQPFRIIEQDTISLQSCTTTSTGRATTRSIFSGLKDTVYKREPIRRAASSSALSTTSLDDAVVLPSDTATRRPAIIHNNNNYSNNANVPDVIASTTTSTITSHEPLVEQSPPPVAPPRRKKKKLPPVNGGNSVVPTGTLKKSTPNGAQLKLPTTTTNNSSNSTGAIESLTRELEHTLETTKPPSVVDVNSKSSDSSKSSTLHSGYSLNITEAVKGQFVVKPQDITSCSTLAAATTTSHNSPIHHMKTARKSNSLDTHETVDAKGTRSTTIVGHYSLGPYSRISGVRQHSPERRKSAGDENLLLLKTGNSTHLNKRTRESASPKTSLPTTTGPPLSDFEILKHVTVLNLDTGERVPLSIAEDKLPKGINPLSLHIMRLTSEYPGGGGVSKKGPIKNHDDDDDDDDDEDSVDTSKMSESTNIMDDDDDDDDLESIDTNDAHPKAIRKRTAVILKRFVKRTVRKAKNIGRHKENQIDILDAVHPGEHNIKLRISHSHKDATSLEFDKVEHVQEMCNEHEGPIWCMKFSRCGRLLATAGQDAILRIWVLRDSYQFFKDMRDKYDTKPATSQESLDFNATTMSASITDSQVVMSSEHASDNTADNDDNDNSGCEQLPPKMAFMPKPFCMYDAHTSDLLDVSWSKNCFILSSSMDKTVRLWHISRKECLCCFQHIDFVTAIAFHPRDDRYFLSGSLDGKLRLWNIPDKKVAAWNEVEGTPKLITAANFCQNGKFAVVGTYDGRCIFYVTDQLKYHTQIHVRSTRGRNRIGRKISGIEPMPTGEDKILVTSNDSRIRLYDLKDLSVSCKYKGYVNVSSQIKASLSHDGKYVVSGSEDRDIYIWRTHHDYGKLTSVRRDRNDYWEAIRAHGAVVTCAIFAHNSEAIIKMIDENVREATADCDAEEDKTVDDPVVEQHSKHHGGYVLVSADFNGVIKVFVNKTKPKHSSLPVSAMA